MPEQTHPLLDANGAPIIRDQRCTFFAPLDLDATAKPIHEWHAGYVSHYNPRSGNVTCVRDDNRGSFVPPHLVRMVKP